MGVAQPCNVAFFTNTYLAFVGGVSNSVHFYAEHLRRAGMQVLIYAPSYLEQMTDTAGVRRIAAIPNATGMERSLPVPGSLKPMLDFVELEFDLVHVHHPFLLGESGMRMAHSERIPLVFTYHTQYEQYTHNVPLDEKVAAKALIKHATDFCEMCDLVIAPTHGIEALLRGLMGEAGDRAGRGCRARYPARGRKWTVVAGGRLAGGLCGGDCRRDAG